MIRAPGFSVAIALIALFAAAAPLRGAAQGCAATDPAMLDMYLAGRELAEAVHAQLIAQSSKPIEPLASLEASMSALNTHAFGFYWVSLYSRRLHEVLDQLDSKPPGPVTRYYDHWDRTQLVTSANLVLRDAAKVSEALARAEGIPEAQSQRLRGYLANVRSALAGCTSPP